jgi:hypothetical protein
VITEGEQAKNWECAVFTKIENEQKDSEIGVKCTTVIRGRVLGIYSSFSVPQD